MRLHASLIYNELNHNDTAMVHAILTDVKNLDREWPKTLLTWHKFQSNDRNLFFLVLHIQLMCKVNYLS